ncbi:hypothetical protein DL546_001041 [Coniochaeta pulveracea]|uniref:BZIP domain-containing protein n=1 Tax=Coniochaeta pulveracea TaxID=177199 RepID=A0A420YB49_9PEZI|nr:hypothetical protein DL546_001041 [Coniochaeta pulveracea]
MAASPAVEGFPQYTTAPALAAKPRGSSSASAAPSPAASASSPPGGPDTPGSVSSSTSTTPAVAIRPVSSARSSQVNISVPANKMNMGSTISPAPGTQLSMTSKEWVIPPRPKPGRKPATDTPPTKRKAQNRAAQRAFRERRAARVGELEDQLDQEREDHEKEKRELQEKIHQLEAMSETLRARCQWLEGTLEKERLDHARGITMQAESLQNRLGSSLSGASTAHTPNASSNTDARPVLPQPFSIAQLITPPEPLGEPSNLTCGTCAPNGPCSCAEELVNTPIGCGGCTLGSRCECLESLQSVTAGVPDLKRPPSPNPPSSSALPDEKRQRSDAGPLEIDFTAMFSTQKKQPEQSTTTPTIDISSEPAEQHDRPVISVEMRDNCGFCEDGTYCVCADTSIIPTPITSSWPTTSLAATAPVPQQAQTQTPPPSDDDVVAPYEVTATGAIKLPPFRHRQQQQTTTLPPPPATTSKCGPNGPGTCAQCLSDPISGLFCRSLAANYQRNQGSSSGGGCCGGSSAGGGCCKSKQPAPLPKPDESKVGLSLSCADAYKTLASHRNFDKAAEQIGEWLPSLKMHPVQMAGRAPMEVEAASIMSVLKGFDIRFGRGE